MFLIRHCSSKMIPIGSLMWLCISSTYLPGANCELLRGEGLQLHGRGPTDRRLQGEVQCG